MSNSVVLLAEPDRALRDLMKRTLSAAGYEVFESSNASQVDQALRMRAVHRARNLVYVLAARLATACAPSIFAVSLERAQLGLPKPRLVLTCEFGALAGTPDIPGCVACGALEKPFDLYELQALAFECRDFLCESGADGTRA